MTDRAAWRSGFAGALGTAVATLAAITWLVDGGALWRYADRHDLLRYTSTHLDVLNPGRTVANLGIIHEPPDHKRPTIMWLGSSSVGFAVDPATVEEEWQARATPGRARVVWQWGLETVGAMVVTDHLLRTGDVRAVVLGLSPHMTMFNPREPRAEYSRVLAARLADAGVLGPPGGNDS